MSTKSNILLIASIMTVFGIMMIPGDISAESNQITVTPINEKVSLEKTTTTMREKHNYHGDNEDASDVLKITKSFNFTMGKFTLHK